MNLIVKQSSQGETINYPFTPPDNEYWVATGYQLLSTGQVTLYNVEFPGWSACKKTSPNGGSYYQVCDHYQFVLQFFSCFVWSVVVELVVGWALMVALLPEFRDGMYCDPIICYGYAAFLGACARAVEGFLVFCVKGG